MKVFVNARSMQAISGRADLLLNIDTHVLIQFIYSFNCLWTYFPIMNTYCSANDIQFNLHFFKEADMRLHNVINILVTRSMLVIDLQ